MKFADSGKDVTGANVNGNLAQTEQKNATVAAQAQPKNATVAAQAKNATAAVNIVQKKAHAHHKKHHTSLAQHSHKTGVKKHGGQKYEAEMPKTIKVH